MVGGRCECLPCLFPFLRPEQSLPCGQCALCLPYKGLLLWETPPSNALPSLAMLPSLHLFLETLVALLSSCSHQMSVCTSPRGAES